MLRFFNTFTAIELFNDMLLNQHYIDGPKESTSEDDTDSITKGF